MTPLESMRVVAGHFNVLGVPYAFLGAAVLPLLVDDPELCPKSGRPKMWT